MAVSQSAVIQSFQPFRQSGLGFGQQVGDGGGVKSQGVGKGERDGHVDADHRAARGEA